MSTTRGHDIVNMKKRKSSKGDTTALIRGNKLAVKYDFTKTELLLVFTPHSECMYVCVCVHVCVCAMKINQCVLFS